ncbi:MAG: UDP-N-acetylmuramate--L-alanine ligase, partial [Candidatus Omnitrophica bacterium]|nr:UDP-N-acetylmuramate--L-alanine ligase [Candidatus Omnitrophota bacterium]
PIPGVSGAHMAETVASYGPVDTEYISWENLPGRLVAEIEAGDLVVTMGAGSITGLPDALLERLESERKK